LSSFLGEENSLVNSIIMISLFITNQETADDRRSGLTLEYYINPII